MRAAKSAPVEKKPTGNPLEGIETAKQIRAQQVQALQHQQMYQPTAPNILFPQVAWTSNVTSPAVYASAASILSKAK